MSRYRPTPGGELVDRYGRLYLIVDDGETAQARVFTTICFQGSSNDEDYREKVERADRIARNVVDIDRPLIAGRRPWLEKQLLRVEGSIPPWLAEQTDDVEPLYPIQSWAKGHSATLYVGEDLVTITKERGVEPNGCGYAFPAFDLENLGWTSKAVDGWTFTTTARVHWDISSEDYREFTNDLFAALDSGGRIALGKPNGTR